MSGDTSYDPTPLYVLNLKFIVEGILTPTIGSIGIIGIKTTKKYYLLDFGFSQYNLLGNLATLNIAFRKKLDLKISFLSLIGLLCVFDILCIVTNIVIFSFPIIDPFYRHQVNLGK